MRVCADPAPAFSPGNDRQENAGQGVEVGAADLPHTRVSESMSAAGSFIPCVYHLRDGGGPVFSSLLDRQGHISLASISANPM